MTEYLRRPREREQRKYEGEKAAFELAVVKKQAKIAGPTRAIKWRGLSQALASSVYPDPRSSPTLTTSDNPRTSNFQLALLKHLRGFLCGITPRLGLDVGGGRRQDVFVFLCDLCADGISGDWSGPPRRAPCAWSNIALFTAAPTESESDSIAHKNLEAAPFPPIARCATAPSHSTPPSTHLWCTSGAGFELIPESPSLGSLAPPLVAGFPHDAGVAYSDSDMLTSNGRKRIGVAERLLGV
ncbi:hypothetical protein C8R45DRAFT_928804 [Mycena sanguinolenta]|nr:hypothetical protein C8R45DRAFT_928804 [Mycena sanguinolenta]